MLPRSAFHSRHILRFQLVLATVAMLLAGLWPPAHGRMILIPVLPGTGTTLLADATQGGALLVGRGPLPDSLVVSGDRAAIAHAVAGHGILMLAAPPAACGELWPKA